MLWIILCLVAAVSLVGAVVINKRLLGTAAEENITSLYFIFITLILTPFVLLLVPVSDFFALSVEIISAVLFIAILNVLSVYVYMKAIKVGDLSTIVPIKNTTPLFVAILAALLISEHVELNVILASVMVVVGAVALSRNSKPHASQSQQKLKSIIYALSVAVIAAIVFVITKYSVSIVYPLLWIYSTFLVSSLLLLFIMVASGSAGSAMQLTRTKFPQIFAAALLATIATYATVTAISLEKASVVSAFLRVELLFGVVAGAFFFKEELTKTKLSGALLILAGLLLVIL